MAAVFPFCYCSPVPATQYYFIPIDPLYAEKERIKELILSEGIFQFTEDEPFVEFHKQLLVQMANNPVGLEILDQLFTRHADRHIQLSSVTEDSSCWRVLLSPEPLLHTFIRPSHHLPSHHCVVKHYNSKPCVETSSFLDISATPILEATLAHELIHILHYFEGSSKTKLSPTWSCFHTMEEEETILGNGINPFISENNYRYYAGLPFRVNHTFCKSPPSYQLDLNTFSMMHFENYYCAGAIDDIEHYLMHIDLQKLSLEELTAILDYLLILEDSLNKNVIHNILHQTLYVALIVADNQTFTTCMSHTRRYPEIINSLFIQCIETQYKIHTQEIIKFYRAFLQDEAIATAKSMCQDNSGFSKYALSLMK